MDPTATDAPALSARERLKAHKASLPDTITTTLPRSGLSVTLPGFLGHDRVMVASKIAGKNRAKIGPILVSQVCLFEGERLTVDEITSLLENADTIHLVNLVLGDAGDEGEDGSGN